MTAPIAFGLLALAIATIPATRRRLPTGPPRIRAITEPRRRAAPQILLSAAIGAITALALGGLVGALLGSIAAAATFVLLRRSARREAQASARAGGQLDGLLKIAALLLRSGAPPPQALSDASRVFEVPNSAALRGLARQIALGQSVERAWREVARDPQLRPIATAAIRSSSSGATLAEAWNAIAIGARADRFTRAEVRAARAGIGVLAPLGLCFLPAFVCIGVVPVVVGLASDIFG